MPYCVVWLQISSNPAAEIADDPKCHHSGATGIYKTQGDMQLV